MQKTGGTLSIKLKDWDTFGEKMYAQDLKAGEYVCLTVRDTGTGIEKSVLEKIFDPYFTTKPMDKGTGLGLSVVHGIVKNYKGEIFVDSVVEEGTRFSFSFLFFKKDVVKVKWKDGLDLPAGNESILMVDDEEHVLKIQKAMLVRLGYDVTDFTDPKQALSSFQAAPGKFDVLITDMTMPNMTGDILAKFVREIRPDIPVIICTGFSEHMDEHIAQKSGIKGFLKKTIARNTLARTVEMHWARLGKQPSLII